jgi:hypothetical protein
MMLSLCHVDPTLRIRVQLRRMRIRKKCLWDILTFPEPPFTNLVAFKRICLARLKSLVERTQTPQYLAFTSVSPESLDEIVRIPEARRGWLLRMTILYDGREEIVIIKLMVDVMYEDT